MEFGGSPYNQAPQYFLSKMHKTKTIISFIQVLEPNFQKYFAL